MVATRRRSQRTIRGALTAACALAGIQSNPVEATEVGTAALYYAEPSRVSAFEGVIEGSYDFGSDRLGTLKLVYDALTGASANGAVPSAVAQTFTRPSGRGRFSVAPGETPLDDTFHDTRFAGSANYSHPLGRLTRGNVGLYGSTEFDYLSLGGNASIAREFNKRNTTLTLSASFTNDTSHPVGGRPIPFASMSVPGNAPPRLDGDGTKHVYDLVVGLTQVIDRATIAQINYSLSRVDGYQTDPYKVVSVVDPLSGDPTDQVFESRPDSRAKQVLYGKLKRHLGRDVVDLSYRFMADDWGVVSNTVDLNYRWAVRPSFYLQPRVRFYRQSDADFYTRWLDDGQEQPSHATADYRLGAFDAWTVGGRFGMTIVPGQTFVARLEYYLQAGDSSPPGAPGALRDFDLFPTVSAWIVNLSYTLGL